MAVQEVGDAVSAAILLAADLIKLMKKHSGVGEVVGALLADEALKVALLKAYAGISQIPAELKAMDATDGVSLGIVVLENVPALVEALKS